MGHGHGVYISQLEFSYTVGWKYKLVKHLWKTVWQYLVELNTYTPHDLTIPLTGVYLKMMYVHAHTKICIASFFVVRPNWEQPKFIISRKHKYIEINA